MVGIIYQIIDFAVLFIVVIIKIVPVSTQFLSDNRLVNRAEIDTFHIRHHGIYIITIVYPR